MRTITLKIPGHIVPKARPRVTGRGTYMPPAYTQCLEKIRLFAAQAMIGKDMLTGDLELTLVNYRKGGGDGDNIQGTIQDGLEGVVYKNDCQITDWKGKKCRAVDGEEYTEVVITERNE